MSIAGCGVSMAAFGDCVRGAQVLSAFPQSAYICALVYGAFALFKVLSSGHDGSWCAIVLPLEVAGDRDRFGCRGGSCGPPATWRARKCVGPVRTTEAWVLVNAHRLLATKHSVLLCFPISTATSPTTATSAPSFSGRTMVTLVPATFLLAIYAGVRERRRSFVVFAVAMTILAYLLVLRLSVPAGLRHRLRAPPGDEAIPAAHPVSDSSSIWGFPLVGWRRADPASRGPCTIQWYCVTDAAMGWHHDLRAGGRRPLHPSAAAESDGSGIDVARTARICRCYPE